MFGRENNNKPLVKYTRVIVTIVLIIISAFALKEVIDEKFIESRAPDGWTGDVYEMVGDEEYYAMYEVVPPQNFELVAYNKKTKMLAIKTYDETEEHIYYDVPESVFNKFIADKSPLEFYNKYLKNTFESDY